MTFTSRVLLSTAAGAFALGAGMAQAQESITIASWGGAYQEAESKAYFQPTAQALGIQIREATLNGLDDVRTQVLAGAVEWDIAELGAEECAMGSEEGLFEPLDYSLINKDGVDPKFIGDDWIGMMYYSNIIAWSTEKFGANGPQNWAEFFDVEKFPGGRTMRNAPQEVLEAALMADGVSPDQLYPLDVDRAFKKLEEIKPHIVAWWSSGAQGAQLIADGEVDLSAAWNGRIYAVKEAGAPVDFTFNQGVINADCFVIPKGAKNKDLAMKAIAMMMSPEIQANLPLHINYGPANLKAFETGKIPADKIAITNSAPENYSKQVPLDVEWWRVNGPEVLERWDLFVQE